MRCPKCSYVGFEESDRCRHCGYDFSLLASPAAPVAAAVPAPAPITFPVPAPPPAPAARPVSSAATAPTAAPDTVLTSDTLRATDDGAALDDLPLRAPAFPVLVHETQPPPARTPLAVRRQTGERPRSRSAPQVVRRSSSPLLEVVPDAAAAAETPTPEQVPAPRGLRLLAAMIDLLLLAGIDMAVVYLTTQLAGLALAEAAELPLVPLAAFLAGLDVAYLAVFTANGGQTLGKMATGLRVVPVTGGLTFGDAIVRVGVATVGALAAGAGFVPALVRADRRALHDYAAQTRVVKVSA